MQNLGLQNILVPNVPTAGANGNVAAKIMKGQSSDEFASLLNSMNSAGQSQAAPQSEANILQLISNSFQKQPELLEHVGLQGQVQSLFGKASANIDPVLIKNLVGADAAPAADFTSKIEALFTQNPKLLAALKANPEVAKNLNLEVVAIPELGVKEAVQFKKELPFQFVKDFVAKTAKQVPESQNMGRIIPSDKVKETALKQVAPNNVLGTERKTVTTRSNVATRAYANKQSQLDTNIIKMPKAVIKEDVALQIRPSGADAEVINFNGFAQQNVAQTTPQVTGPTTMVVDLSSLDASNPQELIQKISDYIQQNSLSKVDGLDLLVKHKDLGQFKISVAQGTAKDQLDMQILTMSREGHDFFKVNEQGLLKTLTQSGVSLGDFSILTKDIPKGGSDFNSFSHNGNSQSDQNNSFGQQSSERRDSERRRELWEEYRERYSA